jgi:hypothetical protein
VARAAAEPREAVPAGARAPEGLIKNVYQESQAERIEFYPRSTIDRNTTPGAGTFTEEMPALSESLKPNRALRLSQAFSKLLWRARLASVTETRLLRLRSARVPGLSAAHA